MAAAWLIVAAVEISISRRRASAQSNRPPSRPRLSRPRSPSLARRRRRSCRRPEPDGLVRRSLPSRSQNLKPEPEPEPEPVAVEPEPEPETVVAFVPRNEEPREWNLWELERLARNATGDVARDEERSYLLMYLREFAPADGNLPADFDGLVRDAFGDLLHAAVS